MKKSGIILIVLLAALTMGMLMYQKDRRIGLASRNLDTQLIEVQDRINAATGALTEAREKLDRQANAKRELALAVAAGERDLAKSDPDGFWAAPPSTWPEWNTNSPYIWFRKEVLASIYCWPFTEQGTLRPAVAAEFAISDQQQAELNARLSLLTAEYCKLEDAAAEVKEQGDQITVKIKPIPDDAARTKREFKTALNDYLGSQRGELLASIGRLWIDDQFEVSKTVSKTITLTREGGGLFFVSYRYWASYRDM